MNNIAIEFENVSKMYRLGLVGTGTLGQDLNRWWKMNVLRQEDPYLKIGQTNDRSTKGDSDFVYALRDINFKIEQGDVVGIIGKNGAGKSTLLKLLSRITAPTTGTIKTRGRLASLLEVGTGFHPELTGRENIYMNGSIMGMTKAEITRKLDEIIDFAGVERYIDTPTKRYSSGMTVRLGFAVAAFLEPEILVVDEVLAVGDAEFQKKAIGKMQDVSSSGGRTVLFVSHNMGSVRKLCRNGVVLKNGMIDFVGDVNSAVDHYLLDQTESMVQNVVVTPKLRSANIINPEVEILELGFNCHPAEMSTDEPIELNVKVRRNSPTTKSANFNFIVNDPITNTRIYDYNTGVIDLPEDKKEFTLKVSLPDHNLKKRQYFIGVDVGRILDDGSCQIIEQLNNIISFEIKYRSKKDNVVWSTSWGLVNKKPIVEIY